MVNVSEKYFHLNRALSMLLRNMRKWECVTESFVKVSRVMSAVRKKQTSGKILADMSWTTRKYEHVLLYLKTTAQQFFPLPWEAGSWYWGVGVFSIIGTHRHFLTVN
jgi:hypothetical protein